jgi:hypothetical protein
MINISTKIENQITSLEKKITGLSGDYKTNTWKRQQEQLHRDRTTDRYRAQKQMLEYLGEEATCRELTQLENALINGAFYENMRSYSASVQYAKEHTHGWSRLTFPAKDSMTAVRMLKAGIRDTAAMVQAIEYFDDLVRKATIPPNPNAKRLRELTFRARLNQKGDVQFTPAPLAAQLLQLAPVNESSCVLEPEAAIGNIADEIRKVTPNVDCVEIVPDFREVLELKGYRLIGSDLLELEPQPTYDAVLMNPPFSEECRHIRHAFQFLKPGGTLAAVCCVRIRHSDKKEYAEFRDWLQRRKHRFISPSEGNFEMTGTPVLLLQLHKEAA